MNEIVLELVKRSMARQKRLNIAGGIYHVITRGINREKIFRDKKDREKFIVDLSENLSKTGSCCYAWALMSNHVHLLIRITEKPLSQLMRKILTRYAIYYNHRHKRCGYLFQNRYKSILCQEDVYFKELIRYIHLNPVRAGIVKTMEELDKYRWTGHSVIIGKYKTKWQKTNKVLSGFGEKRKLAITEYRQFVEDGWNMGKRDELIGGGLLRSFGGWAGVREALKNKIEWRGDERLLGDDEFVEKVIKKAEEALEKKEKMQKENWNIERVITEVCEKEAKSETIILGKQRTKERSRLRSIVAYLCYNDIGISGAEIGRYLGISKPSVCKAIERGEKYVRNEKLKLII